VGGGPNKDSSDFRTDGGADEASNGGGWVCVLEREARTEAAAAVVVVVDVEEDVEGEEAGADEKSNSDVCGSRIARSFV